MHKVTPRVNEARGVGFEKGVTGSTGVNCRSARGEEGAGGIDEVTPFVPLSAGSFFSAAPSLSSSPHACFSLILSVDFSPVGLGSPARLAADAGPINL